MLGYYKTADTRPIILTHTTENFKGFNLTNAKKPKYEVCFFSKDRLNQTPGGHVGPLLPFVLSWLSGSRRWAAHAPEGRSTGKGTRKAGIGKTGRQEAELYDAINNSGWLR